MIKCLYGIYFTLLDSDEYQFLGITIIIHVYHVLIISCGFYIFCPISACSCIDHASHMHTRCTLDAHTLSIDMFCIHSTSQVFLCFLAFITCSCVYVMHVISILGLFSQFILVLWTNMYLIKFVTIFVYGLCICSLL